MTECNTCRKQAKEDKLLAYSAFLPVQQLAEGSEEGISDSTEQAVRPGRNRLQVWGCLDCFCIHAGYLRWEYARRAMKRDRAFA